MDAWAAAKERQRLIDLKREVVASSLSKSAATELVKMINEKIEQLSKP